MGEKRRGGSSKAKRSDSKDICYSIKLAFKFLLPGTLINHCCYFLKAGISLDVNHDKSRMATERSGDG